MLHMIGYGTSQELYSNVGLACGVYPGYTSKPGIEIKDLSQKEIRFDAKSPTWPTTKYIAHYLINTTEQERNPESSYVRFNLFGRYAFINVIKQMMGCSAADNCITWALNKLLHAGINLRAHNTGSNVLSNSVNITDSVRYTTTDITCNPYTINTLCQFAKEGNVDAIRINFKLPLPFDVDELTQNACVGPVESYLGWYTPLALAVAYNQLDIVKILIEKYKANSTIKVGRNRDFTALDCAKHDFWFAGKKDIRIQQFLDPEADHIEMTSFGRANI